MINIVLDAAKIALFLAALLLFFVFLGCQWLVGYVVNLAGDVCNERERE